MFKKPLSILVLTVMMFTGVSTWAAMDSAGNVIQIPELDQAKLMLKEKKFHLAIKLLTEANKKVPNHADVMNLLGYSLRKTGRTKKAEIFYKKALEISPQHLGALEYYGHLFVEIGQAGKAKKLLARLKKACVLGCKELDSLKKAIKDSHNNLRNGYKSPSKY